MPKKKNVVLDKQLNVRVSSDLYNLVEYVAVRLRIDPTDLVRMILAEKLPEYENRANHAAPLPPQMQNPQAT